VVVLPRTPPLKSTSGPVEENGGCSGKATSTSAEPAPTIASGQARLASAVVRDASCAALQVGRPTASIPIVLSTSSSRFSTAGGWLPSRVLISPKMRAVIGALPCLGSFAGKMPPLSVTQRLPAHSTLRLPKATAAKTSANPSPTAAMRTKCLLMLCPLPPGGWIESIFARQGEWRFTHLAPSGAPIQQCG
jgi:hypothetical protein